MGNKNSIRTPDEIKGPYQKGMRVQVNNSFPYGHHGRKGTVLSRSKGKEGGIVVQFDDEQPPRVASWHWSYFDRID